MTNAASSPSLDTLDAGRHWLTAEVGRRLVGSCGIDANEPLVLGVSGGADSVALLLACQVLVDRGDLAVPHVVYVHHHLRSEADDEAHHVGVLCHRLGVPCAVRHVYPSNQPGNTSEHARRLRYAALAEFAREQAVTRVAVAHHGDDQLETLLIALCRGAGVDGLRGMSWRRSLEGAVELVRPLLAARRSDCEAYCRSADLRWIVDRSNHDRARVRARLRDDVIPVLEELWPEAGRRATTAAESVTTARDALQELLEEHFGAADVLVWPRDRIAGLPPAVICAGLRRAAVHAAPQIADRLGRRTLDPAAAAIAAGAGGGKTFDWPGDLRLEVTAATARLVRRA